MDTSIRDLKANLSQYIRQVEAGATITLSIQPSGGKNHPDQTEAFAEGTRKHARHPLEWR